MKSQVPQNWPHSIAKSAAVLVFLCGALVMTGWWQGITALMSVYPGWSQMSAITAFCFCLAGVSLFTATRIRDREAGRAEGGGRWTIPLFAWTLGPVSLILIGLNKLRELPLGRGPSLEIILLSETLGPPTPGLMVPATALSFVLGGCGLLLGVSRRFSWAFHGVVLLGVIVSWLGLSHYVFSGEPLVTMAGMAIHSAICFLIFNVGILCLRPDAGVMSLLTAGDSGGQIARRLVPSALLLPIFAGWLALQGQQAGWFGPEAAVSLFALILILVFGSLILMNAELLHRAEVDRRQVEVALRESEERFRAMANSAPVLIWVGGPDRRCTWVNQQWLQMVGRGLGDELGEGWMTSLHPDDRPRWRESFNAAFDSRKPLELECRLRRQDGAYRWVLAQGAPRYNGRGEFAGYIASCADITERREVEDALARERDLLRLLINNLPACIYVKDLQGRFLVYNRASLQMVGLREEAEAIGKTVFDFFPKEIARLYHADDQALFETGEPIFDREEPTMDRTGTRRWFLTSKLPLRKDGRIVGLLGISHDVTERKQTEQRLSAQVARLELLRHTTRAIGQRQDLESILRVVVQNLEEGLPVEFSAFFHFEESTRELRLTSLGTRTESLMEPYNIKFGAVFLLTEPDLEAGLRGRLVCHADLSHAAGPLPTQLRRAGFGSCILSPMMLESRVSGFLAVARRGKRAFSESDSEFLQQLTEHVGLAAHQAQLFGALQKAYKDLSQTREVLMQQERLRALGQMASGVAHDINNAIVPIGLYCELLLKEEPALTPAGRDHLRVIQRAIGDVAQTVTRMREFYRQRDPQSDLKPVNLNAIVEQVIDLTRARWSDMPQQRGIVIHVSTELAPSLPAIMAAEGELREAITNLIFNAVDAMPGGGSLTLRTRVIELEPDAPAPREGNGRRVVLEVSDNGAGMDEETQRRCLEPFFTTKGERGTGLGLAMVYGFAMRHDAELRIQSALGAGTTVQINWPAGDSPAPAPEEARSDPRPDQKLSILVIDDDPLVSSTLRHVLRADGHSVTVAGNGEEGVRTFHAAIDRAEPFDIVITDLGMPQMDGRQVAAAVKEARPSTPVILLTGWGQRLEAESDTPPHVDLVLSKPPTLAQLRDAIARFRR